jgi:hypothetical protein
MNKNLRKFMLFSPVFSILLFSSLLYSQIRELSVKVLADEEFRQDPNWQQKAESFLSSNFLKALTHELGPLFGAVHVDSPSFLMDTFVRGDHFDPLNSSLILLYKQRPFNKSDFPLAKENMSAAIEIYKKICTSIQYTQAKMGTDISEKHAKKAESLRLKVNSEYLKELKKEADENHKISNVNDN